MTNSHHSIITDVFPPVGNMTGGNLLTGHDDDDTNDDTDDDDEEEEENYDGG